MNEPKLLATMDVLRDFGFLPSDELDVGFDESLVYDFGNYKLYADLGVNKYFRKVVLFSGSGSTGRNMGLIELRYLPKSSRGSGALPSLHTT
jgi:hypothetical protein